MPLGRVLRGASVTALVAFVATGAMACSAPGQPGKSGTTDSDAGATAGATTATAPATPTSPSGTPTTSITNRPTTGDTAVPPTTPASTPSARTPTQQASLDQALRDAAWANDVATARRLVTQGADVNAKDSTQQSAYLVATSEGYLDLLRLTLASGAKVDDKDSWNGTGLIRAAERGHGLVVGQLLQAGIDRDHVNRIGYQAIHESVWLGDNTTTYVDTVRTLVAGGVELTRPSGSEGLTPLQMARERGFTRLAAVLQKATTAGPMADPDAALLRAAASGDADTVALALRAGADLGTRDDRRRTALLLAVTGDHLDAARLLVAMGADPDALDGQHGTP